MKPHKISAHSAHSDNFYFYFFYPLSDWVEILRGFTNFFFKQMLKVSVFYLEEQKSFIPKTNIIGQESSNRWRLLSQFSMKVLVHTAHFGRFCKDWSRLFSNQKMSRLGKTYIHISALRSFRFLWVTRRYNLSLLKGKFMIYRLCLNNLTHSCLALWGVLGHFIMYSHWIDAHRQPGPSEGLKIRGCPYYLVGIICPPWLR